jgi:hypothetical protein
MEDKIKEYIKSEISKLSDNVKSVKLKGVYPDVLEEVLGGFTNEMETNGWQVDYWVNAGKYSVSGCMYYGTATISLAQ